MCKERPFPGLMMEHRLMSDLESALPDGIVKTRVSYLLRWYHKKAAHYKFVTYIATGLSVTLPAFLSLLNTNVGKELLGSACAGRLLVILPLLSSVGAGFYAFIQSRTNWIRYRLAAERIKRETVLYINTYSKGYSQSAEQEFLQRIEDICANEVLEWENLRGEAQQTPQQAPPQLPEAPTSVQEDE